MPGLIRVWPSAAAYSMPLQRFHAFTIFTIAITPRLHCRLAAAAQFSSFSRRRFRLTFERTARKLREHYADAMMLFRYADAAIFRCRQPTPSPCRLRRHFR
jgi:hypothetical protein